MLIISIGWGRRSDPFTYSCICEDEILDPDNMEQVISFVYKEHSVLPSTLDQILIVKDNQIIKQYDNEDGLGNDDQDLNMEVY